MRHSAKRAVGALLGGAFLLSLLGGFAAARAQVTCGAIITVDSVMTTDLTCAVDPAVHLSGAKLDMNGHRISGPGTCILIAGAGSKLMNGSVRGCPIGVDVQGSPGTKLTNVVAIANSARGVRIDSGSGGTKLIGCSAIGGFIGFEVLPGGGGNSFTHCVASDNGGNGFSISGDGNTIRDSVAVDNSAGMNLTGNANNLSRNVLANNAGGGLGMNGTGKVADNRATDSGSDGFLVSGGGAKLTKNVAANNGNIGFNLSGVNLLKNNTAAVNAAQGFLIASTGTTVNSCIAAGNTTEGFSIGGSSNTINGSAAMVNGSNGIFVGVGSSSNTLSKNLSIESGDDDLQDNNLNCDSNAWSNNIFRTSEAGGVSGHACIK